MCEWDYFSWHPAYTMAMQRWTEEACGWPMALDYSEYWAQIRDLDIFWFYPEIPNSTKEGWQ